LILKTTPVTHLTTEYVFVYNSPIARPRKLDTLTTPLSARIRNDQLAWLRGQADSRFEGELSRALRWALDQAEVFASIMREDDPVHALDEMLNPPDQWQPEDEVLQAERELEAWKREQAIKRAQKKAREDR
jgi:hypothetical protein